MKAKKWLLLSLTLMLMACTPIQAVPMGPAMNSSGNSTQKVAAGQTGEVQANGITLAYESFGSPDAETILLIGGTGQQLVDWPLELVNALVGRGYRVIRFDNRDIGLSTKFTAAGVPDGKAIEQALTAGKPPPLPYTLHDMAADTVGLLDALQIEQAHLVGVSMGGAIAQLVAIDFPARVLSLTLLMADSGDPKLPVVAKPEAFANVPPQPQVADRAAYIDWQVKTWQALAGDYPVDAATLRQWAIRNFERGYDAAGYARQGTVILVDRYEPTTYRFNHLNTITAPTVVLQGDADPIVTVAAAKELAERIPQAELRIIPGLGHFVPDALIPSFVAAITSVAERADTQALG